MTAHLERELADDAELVDQVLPDYPPLGKRMLQDNGWFRDAAARQRRAGQRGRSRASMPRWRGHDVAAEHRGRRPDPRHRVPPEQVPLADGDHGAGVRLHDVWGEDPRAYLGITMPGFPNLFCLYGPNTNPVVGSVVFMLECQVNYVMQSLGALLEGGYASMECRRDVHDEYNERVDARTST